MKKSPKEKLLSARKESEKILSEAKETRQKAEEELEKARKKALDLWDKTVTESEFIIDELDNLRKEIDKKDFKEKLEKAKKDYESKAKENETLKRPEKKKPIKRPLKKGDSVRIISLDKEATVLSPADKKGYVELSAGIIKTKIHLSDLELIDSPKIKAQIYSPAVRAEKGSRTVSNEIDIRGENVLDAESIIEDFLHGCYLAGLKTVSIIHGKGTGVLRQGSPRGIEKKPSCRVFPTRNFRRRRIGRYRCNAQIKYKK